MSIKREKTEGSSLIREQISKSKCNSNEKISEIGNAKGSKQLQDPQLSQTSRESHNNDGKANNKTQEKNKQQCPIVSQSPTEELGAKPKTTKTNPKSKKHISKEGKIVKNKDEDENIKQAINDKIEANLQTKSSDLKVSNKGKIIDKKEDKINEEVEIEKLEKKLQTTKKKGRWNEPQHIHNKENKMIGKQQNGDVREKSKQCRSNSRSKKVIKAIEKTNNEEPAKKTKKSQSDDNSKKDTSNEQIPIKDKEDKKIKETKNEEVKKKSQIRKNNAISKQQEEMQKEKLEARPQTSKENPELKNEGSNEKQNIQGKENEKREKSQNKEKKTIQKLQNEELKTKRQTSKNNEKSKTDTFESCVQTRSMTQTLNIYYKNYVLPKADKQKEFEKIAKGYVEKLISHIVDNEPPPFLFSFTKTILNAGSVSTRTAVRGCSDFDFNLSLSVQNVKVKTDGEIAEWCEEHKKLTQKAIIGPSESTTKIPNGYAVVYGCDGIIYPRKVKEVLHNYLLKAVSALNLEGITIQNLPRGPAVGLTIKIGTGEDIDIDLSPSIDIPSLDDIIMKGWPNARSSVFDSEKGKQIKQEVLKTKMHVVPKKNLFWRLSYSKRVKTLINTMDRHGECRKKCHKILKYDFQTWKVNEKSRFEGISTFIFSNHLLWMNEENKDENYWKSKNIDNCYKDMLNDLASCLEKVQLPHYFNTVENLLQNVDAGVLNLLIRTIRKRIEMLETSSHHEVI